MLSTFFFTATVLAQEDDIHYLTFGSTSWGEMGKPVTCEDGHFFNGYRLKIEAQQGRGDDTAMNAIEMICDNQNWRSMAVDGHTSNAGPFGDWSNWLFCPDGEHIDGVRFFNEPAKSHNDDTAANNMHVHCKGWNGPGEWVEHIVDSAKIDGLYGYGTNVDEQFCPSGYAATGFATRVEKPQGSGDDTALNQLQLLCTKAPDCVHIKITNVHPDVDKMTQSAGKPESMKLATADNCNLPGDVKWTSSSVETKSKQVSDTYSHSKSWEHTFTNSLSEGVSVTLEEGLIFEKVSATFSFSATQTWSTTNSKTDTVTKGTVSVTTHSSSSTWQRTVPGYMKYDMMTTYNSYKGSVPYTATAICYADKEGKHEISREAITGTWSGVAIGKEVFSVADKSDTCENRHVCKCAGVSGTWHSGGGFIAGGNVCTAPTSLTENRGPEWCYVFRGACTDASEIDTMHDYGLNPSVFQWSKMPCVDECKCAGDSGNKFSCNKSGVGYCPSGETCHTERGVVSFEDREKLCKAATAPPAGCQGDQTIEESHQCGGGGAKFDCCKEGLACRWVNQYFAQCLDKNTSRKNGWIWDAPVSE